MDVIAQALFFGFRVTWWLGVQSFFASCHATKAIFEGIFGHIGGGILMSSRLAVTITSAIFWSGMWAVGLALLNGAEGLISGAVIGVVWGIFCATKVIEAWHHEDLLRPPDEQEEQVSMLDKPLSLEDDSRPLSPVDELIDDDDDRPIIITDMDDGEDDDYYDDYYDDDDDDELLMAA
jgi:hypothetical protein